MVSMTLRFLLCRHYDKLSSSSKTRILTDFTAKPAELGDDESI
jgi:hypothetical protein